VWSSSCPCLARLARHARPAFIRDADEAKAFSKLYRYERRQSGVSNKGFQELQHTPGYLMYRGQGPTVRGDRRGLLCCFRRRIFEKWLCFVKKGLRSPSGHNTSFGQEETSQPRAVPPWELPFGTPRR
jgi:hypothetical protein